MSVVVLFIAGLSALLVATIRRAGPVSGRTVPEIAIGFLGWFALNTLLWTWVLETDHGTVIMNPARLLPLCVNLPVLLVLGRMRRGLAQGVLAAVLVNALGTLFFSAPGPFGDRRIYDILSMLPFYLSALYPGL